MPSRTDCGAEKEEKLKLTRIVNGFSRMPIPHKSRLSLRRDSDSFQLALLVTGGVELVEAGRDALVNLDGVRRRIVLVPARLRVN